MVLKWKMGLTWYCLILGLSQNSLNDGSLMLEKLMDINKQLNYLCMALNHIEGIKRINETMIFKGVESKSLQEEINEIVTSKGIESEIL